MADYAVYAGLGALAGYQFEQTTRAAKFQEIQLKEQAQQERDAARDREVERRRRLVQALASQNAEAGAVGAAPGVGSRAAIALADARRANFESLADRASTNRRALLLERAGAEAARQGRYQARAGLIQTGLMAVGV